MATETFSPKTQSGEVLSGIYEQRMQGIFEAGPYMISKIAIFGLGTGSLVRRDLMDNYFNKVGFNYSQTSIRTELPFVYTVAIDSGILTAIVFLGLFVYVILKTYKLSHTTKDNEGFYFILFLSLVGYFIILMGNGVFSTIHLFFLLIGILNVKINLDNQKYA